MKKTCVLLLLAILTPLVGMAQTVNVADARSKAASLRSSRQHRVISGQAQTPLLCYTSTPTTGITTYYVFNYPSGGFAIIGGDATAKEILGYCDEGRFNIDSIPVGLRDMLACYDKDIMTAARSATHRKAEAATRESISPLIQTKWGQDEPFNSQIPTLGSNYAPLITGCTATASAQIMKYYNYPTKGIGSKSYSQTFNTASGKITLNFSADYENTTYDWDNMLNIYEEDSYTDEQAKAVGTLLYHAAVALNTSFGQKGSSAYTNSPVEALVNYFGYSNEVKFVERDEYTEDWESLIYSELAAGRPVLYSGQSTEGGHGFVCDGYDASTGNFHINWGWEGSADGYFPLTGTNALNSGNGQYNSDQTAIIHIIPNSESIDVESVTLSQTSANVYTEKTVSLTATVAPSNAFNKSLVWASSDNSVATVATDGTVTGIKEGTATITVTSKSNPSATASCVVTVTKFPFSLKILPTKVETSVYETEVSGNTYSLQFNVSNNCGQTFTAYQIDVRLKGTETVLVRYKTSDEWESGTSAYYPLPVTTSTSYTIDTANPSKNFAVDLYYTVDGVEYVTSTDKTIDYTPGDPNLDGRVSAQDVTSVIKVLNHGNVEEYFETAADVNGDGVVDKKDIDLIVNKVLGK